MRQTKNIPWLQWGRGSDASEDDRATACTSVLPERFNGAEAVMPRKMALKSMLDIDEAIASMGPRQ